MSEIKSAKVPNKLIDLRKSQVLKETSSIGEDFYSSENDDIKFSMGRCALPGHSVVHWKVDIYGYIYELHHCISQEQREKLKERKKKEFKVAIDC